MGLATILCAALAFSVGESFAPSSTSRRLQNGIRHNNAIRLNAGGKDWERELDKAQEREYQKGRPGETVAGAVLGGLLLGPFGALFGASIGESIGRNTASARARDDEMKRLGLSKDMLETANEIGVALERNMEGLKAVQESFDTQKRLARRLDADAEALYETAKTAMEDGDEAKARDCLLERNKTQEKLKDVLKTCASAKQQVEIMESNTSVLEQRAMEMDALLRRTVGAKAVQDSAGLGMSLSSSDPLLDKFKDLGID